MIGDISVKPPSYSVVLSKASKSKSYISERNIFIILNLNNYHLFITLQYKIAYKNHLNFSIQKKKSQICLQYEGFCRWK